MSSKISISNFVQKLWKLLQGSDKLENFIIWVNDGKSFVITNKQKFSQKILPLYFKHKNFTSFVRQLNMYNFHKVKSEKFEFQFEHQLFMKGCRQFLVGIKRKPTEADLEFGKQLLKRAQQKVYHDALNNLKQNNTETLAIKTEITLDSPPNINLIQSLEKQNLNIKTQNTLLLQYVEELKANYQMSINKVELLFQAFKNTGHSGTFINFKSSDFMDHLKSSETPYTSHADYLKYSGDSTTFYSTPSILFATPMVIPTHTYQTNSFYYA